MRSRTVLEEAFERHKAFTAFPEEPPPPPPVVRDNRCVHARLYEEYLTQACSEAFANPTHININEAYLDCYLKYMELRGLVPKSHRNCIGERASHRCIFHIMERYFCDLRTLEMMLPRQRLYVPALPPAPLAVLPVEVPRPIIPPPPTFGDVFINEQE